jgi:hypothetical protein
MNYWPQYGMHVQRQWSRVLGENVLCLEGYWKTDAATLSRMDKGGLRKYTSYRKCVRELRPTGQ